MSDAALEVVSVAGPAWIQDLGRAGHMHEAVPPGGALLPPWLIAANTALGNPQDAAGIECFGSLRLRALRPVHVSVDGAAALRFAADETIAVAPGARSAVYFAVAGGIEVPLVLGGRGTLPVAALGGHEGRALRRGDRLGTGTVASASVASVAAVARVASAESDCIRVLEGPDSARFAPEAFTLLLEEAWQVTADSDRAGLRLRGRPLPVLPAAQALSLPMVQGAIQVPPSGQPIVLGPDHPTTGGYPVIACVLRADLADAFARRPGAGLRFRRVTLDEAYAASAVT